MHIQRNWSGDQDELRVYYRTSATSDWVQLCEYTDDISIWTTEEEIALPTTTYQIAFEMTDGYGFGVAIDAVTIDEAPACPRPTNLEVNYTLGATSATMSWNGTATSYNIDVNGTVTTGVTSPYSLSGLVFETTYTVRVQANCGSDGLSNWLTVTFTPTDRIRIGTGIEANFLLPTHPGYNYSLTEQIYTTSELGDEGDILNLEFYKVGTDACSRDLDIYMVSTTESEFGVENWIPVTASDLVYSGTVTFNDDAWTSITLTTPFEYDGVNNVAIVVYDQTGDYIEGDDVNFLTFEPTSTQAVFFFSDDNSFDPTSDFSSFSNNSDYWNNLSEKNQIRILKSAPPTCRRPIDLVVNNVGNTSATLVWTDANTSPASSWKVQISSDMDFPTGTPELTPTINGQYDFTGLTAGTTYYVRVKADCGTVDGESRWSAPISFTTAYCSFDDQCEIYYNLYPDYGYGYTDGYINVIDEATGRLLDRWVPDYGGGYEGGEKDASDYTGVLSGLCPGRVLLFEWDETEMGEIIDYKSTKDGEEEGPSFAVYDRNEEEILNSFDEIPFYWTVNCNEVTCSRPTGLMVESVGMTTATVSWDADPDVTYNLKVNDVEFTNVGTPTLSSYTLNHTIENLEANTTYRVSLQANCGSTDGLSSWTRPVIFTTDPCEDMCEIYYELSDDYNWNGFQLQVWDAVADTQLAFWGGDESTSGSLRVCDGSQLLFKFVRIFSSYNASYCTYAVYDANYQEIFSGSGTFSDVNYTVNCHACPFPTGLEVSDVTASSATLSWSLNDGAVNTAQSYTVRYRKTGETATFYDDFENDPSSTWTTIGGHNWGWGNTGGHSGSGYMFCSTSAVSDYWLVTPPIALQGTMKVWSKKAWSDNNGTLEIYVSTTSNNNVDNFTHLEDRYAGTTYGEYAVDLSNYNGRQGYVAILLHNTYQSQGSVSVDDFGIYVTQDNEWTTATVTNATTLAIQGLDPSTTYEWEVLASCGQSNESLVASSSFTTLPPSIAYEADKWYAISIPTHQEWQNYTTLVFDQDYYRIYLYAESLGTWQAQNNGQLRRGRGYIYRQGAEGSLTFNGILNSGNYPNAQTLTNSCTDDALKGFNLIGNPYTHPIYKGGAFPTTGLVSGYYSLNPDGSWIARTNSVPIAMGQGVLVKVSSSVTEPISLSFTDVATPASSKGTDDHGLQFTVESFGHSDVAYAFLSDGEGLNKIGHLSEGLPTLSIPVADRRYALAHVGADCKQFDLHFRAATAGSHTLTLSAEKRPAYLHLIDRQTGADIDLLANGSYTFDATPVDAQNRFLVKLAPGGELPSSTFAFQTDNGMLIEGTGTLQAYDVMGRQLFVREVASQLSIPKSQFPGTGVYILRLGEKSQKIVIK